MLKMISEIAAFQSPRRNQDEGSTSTKFKEHLLYAVLRPDLDAILPVGRPFGLDSGPDTRQLDVDPHWSSKPQDEKTWGFVFFKIPC